MSFMGSGFTAINIGDEIIEINNQVVVSYRFCNYKIFRIQMKGPFDSSSFLFDQNRMTHHEVAKIIISNRYSCFEEG